MATTRETALEPTDPALRDDVRRLGRLVGELLVEQAGGAFYQRVEAARTEAIRRREEGEGAEALAGRLSGLEAREADALGRAFSTYFQVVNIAERVQRIRRRRDYQLAGAAPQPDGLHDVLLRLRTAGVDAAELLDALPRIDVEPVFTAHPTEASRRSLLEKEQEIVRALIADFVGPRTEAERAVDWARLRMALTCSWQTADLSLVRPSVQDELDHVDFYLSDPLYRVIPVFYEVLEQAITEVYGTCPALPRIVRFASWVGGDMDGNPNVGAATIAAALRKQRQIVLACYRRECVGLARLLSQTLDRVGVDERVLARVATYRDLLPDAAAKIRPRHRNMPYRCLLQLVGARLAASAHDAPGGYTRIGEFAADIELVAASLRANAGAHAGWFAVRRLQRRIATFGFHLARLDARQDSRVHAAALAEALGPLPEDAVARAGALAPYAEGSRSIDVRADTETLAPCCAVFATFADARARHGDAALGAYVISMAGSVADVLAVLALARAGGLVDDSGAVPLDVAPLFETIDDLRGAPATFAALLTDRVYRDHLRARGDRQMIMLGYSDSAKDGGILAARWSLQRAQVELLSVARMHGITLTFFHGRGGSISRGGGKVTRGVIAAPRGAVDGRLRVTEQGEVIHQKYGIRALALRSLEQATGAVLLATLRPRPPEPREARWREAMGALAEDGASAYRELVAGTAGFVDYFRLATPIDVIERMTLGSRPARRGVGAGGVESLRAIPWVFAWTQCRAGLTGWYGVGTALERAAARGDEAVLAEMTRDWAFFRTLLEDLEMLLAKCDLGIAERFSQLAGPLHDRFFPRIAAEFERTASWLLRLRGRGQLLADDPRLAESIRLRNPYTDPISLIQVDLLQRWRASGSADDALFGALVSGVHGVAQALQNTG
ncbi:MAG: phosphoenolpyruvate carboxylase [Dokdonella sp.]|uniref:phosphoenolpyruvate carboxylase n=1 Tax=Dokdonella sp. TaxID=2291710 RepID=UPI003F813862